jgi:hypothetical protein
MSPLEMTDGTKWRCTDGLQAYGLGAHGVVAPVAATPIYHLPSPSAEFKNEWSYISTTRIPHGVFLHRIFCTTSVILLLILRSLKVLYLALGESLSVSAGRMVRRILGPAKVQVTD